MDSFIKLIFVILFFGLVGISPHFKKIYNSIKKETIYKVQKGMPSLETFSKRLIEN